jgi:hypothetical protein
MASMPAPVVEFPLPTSPVPFEPAPELLALSSRDLGLLARAEAPNGPGNRAPRAARYCLAGSRQWVTV